MLARPIVFCALAGALFTLSLSPSRADTASDIKALQKGTELYLTGFNRHIVNGLGAADGGIVAGYFNTISDPYASVDRPL